MSMRRSARILNPVMGAVLVLSVPVCFLLMLVGETIRQPDTGQDRAGRFMRLIAAAHGIGKDYPKPVVAKDADPAEDRHDAFLARLRQALKHNQVKEQFAEAGPYVPPLDLTPSSIPWDATPPPLPLDATPPPLPLDATPPPLPRDIAGIGSGIEPPLGPPMTLHGTPSGKHRIQAVLSIPQYDITIHVFKDVVSGKMCYRFTSEYTNPKARDNPALGDEQMLAAANAMKDFFTPETKAPDEVLPPPRLAPVPQQGPGSDTGPP